jgi:hypothetical protein
MKPEMRGEGGDYRGYVEKQDDGSATWRIERVDLGKIVDRGDAQSVSAAMDEVDRALGPVRGNGWSSL